VAEKFIMSSGSSAIIVDESTGIKNIDTIRFNKIFQLGINTNYRRILTGTPVAHTPVDFYAQLTFLDSCIFYGWSLQAFKTHFCIMGGYKHKEILGYINQAELATIVAQHSYQATKEECMDLPERVFQVRDIEPSDNFWKTYEAIVDEVLLSLEGGLMTTQLIIQKITKLRQLCGGWLLPDWPKDPETGKPIKKGKRTATLIDPTRLNDMFEMLEEFRGSKGIVWCFFEHEVINIAAALKEEGWNPVIYYGGLNDKQRNANENAFERGDADIFVGQIDTGGMGLTLNAASFMVYYNRPVYLLPRVQSLDRNYRKGQTKKTTVIDLVVRGTIDESNLESLNSRQELADRLMKASRDPEALSNLLIRRPKGKWNKGKKK
jgi:SNF2 family DNA or RNA helicase